MQISEIRIKLVENRSDRLKAFCSVTFDNSFVVRDLKIIEGADGYFVAMPSRKLTDRCHGCGAKNHLRAKFCSECGARLDENRSRRRSTTGRTKLHADVAHPINSESRDYIQSEVVKAFEKEVELSLQPGYKPADMDDYGEDDYHHHVVNHASGGTGSSGHTTNSASAAPAETTPAETAPADAVPAEADPNQDASEENRQDSPSSGFGEGLH
ncbi:MAG: SpoVG family protein [Sedimentisphaerales bacterium]|nr:SpoVG family protein [Sedimentisphaerales bacterium]